MEGENYRFMQFCSKYLDMRNEYCSMEINLLIGLHTGFYQV